MAESRTEVNAGALAPEARRHAAAARAAIVLSFLAFVSLGMPDGLHGVAWPGVRATFGLPLDAIGAVMLLSTAGYMTSSFFVGSLVRRLGIGRLLAASCTATGLALMGYSVSPVWPLFFAVAFVSGLGAGAIDAGLNAWVARTHGEDLMQWLHASFGVGITIGPVVMTLAIAQIGTWRAGYLIVSIAQLLLGLLFLTRSRVWAEPTAPAGASATGDVAASGGEGGKAPEDAEAKPTGAPSLASSLGRVGTWLSMLLFFMYTGVELGLGFWAFSVLTEARGVDPVVAGAVTSGYWASFTVGRILAGVAAKRIRMTAVLPVSLALAALGLTVFAIDLGAVVSVGAIALTGIAIAPIFPGLVSDTARRVGRRHADNVIGIEISAAGLGLAALPALAGVVARRAGVSTIPFFILGCLVVLILVYVVAHLRHPEDEPRPEHA